MTVALDNVAEFAQWTTASPVSIEFTPVGTARAMVVGVAHNEAAGTQITGVTVEGVAMEYKGLEAVGGEPGTVYLFFLGSGIPAGTVTVEITTTGTSGTKWASVASYTAGGDCTMPVTAHVAGATTPQITLDSGADTSLRTTIIFCTTNDLADVDEMAGMSASVAATEHDFGTTTAKFGHQAAPASGSVVVGYSFAGGGGIALFGGAIVESVIVPTGTVAVTQADQTSTASGSVNNGIVGTLAVIQAPQTSTASGNILTPVIGTVAVTQANQVGLAQGSFPVTGTSSVFQANQTSTASAYVGVNLTGTVAVTQANQTSTAVGGAGADDITGTLAYTQEAQTSASAGATWSSAGGIPGQAVDGGLRFEAFQLPDLGFARKFDLTRWVNQYTVAEKWDQISDASLALKSDFPRLADFLTVDPADHSNDVGSIVRVLRGQTPIFHYMVKQRDDTWSSDNNLIPCHLEGMEYFMDKATVPRYDYPAKPSLDPDHIYGAKSILRTIGGETTNEVQEIDTDATSGTFTLTFAASTTGPLAFNATAADIETELELLPGIVDVDVSGAGDPINPWTITFIDPTGDSAQIVANVGTLNQPISVATIRSGGTLSPRPWHGSYNPVTQLTHGTYDLFEIVTTPVPAGDTYALAIDGGTPIFPEDYPGCQLIQEVTPGRTYRASIPVRANSGTETFRFVIRDMSENWIAATPDTVIGTTYTTMAIPTFKVPAGVTQIIYRVGIVTGGNPGKVFVGIESALLAPGQEAAPFGKIMWDLFDLVQTAGRLTWLVPTFTDTHDSDGVLWDRDLEWAVKRRQSLWQLCEYAKRWFYLNRVRWNDAAGVFNWDAFNPNGGGTDYTGTGLAISGRTGVTSSGVISHRAPEATYYDAEGDGGQWGEFEDATLTGAWGPLDKYYPNRQGLDSAGLDILAERLVDDATSRTEGIVIRLEAPTALPWDRFRPGDLVTINLGPKVPKQVMRCMAVVASMGADDSHPAYDTHWGSVVYQGEAATAHMLRTLWRKFETLDMFDAPATIDPSGAGCCPSCPAHAYPTELTISSSSNDISGGFNWAPGSDPDELLAWVDGQPVLAKPGLYTIDLNIRIGVTFTAAGVATGRVTMSADGNDAGNGAASATWTSTGAFGRVAYFHVRFWAHTEAPMKGIGSSWVVERASTYPTANLIDNSGFLPALSPSGTGNFKEMTVVRHSAGCAQERICA